MGLPRTEPPTRSFAVLLCLTTMRVLPFISAAVLLALVQFVAADCTLWTVAGIEIGTYHSTFSKSYWCCEKYDTAIGVICTECCYMAFWPIVCVILFFTVLCCCCCCLVVAKGAKSARSSSSTTYSINTGGYQPAAPAPYQQATVYEASAVSSPQMQYAQPPAYYGASQPAQPVQSNTFYPAQPAAPYSS